MASIRNIGAMAEEQPAEESLTDFDKFSVMVGRGMPTRLALSLLEYWRAGEQATREHMEEVCEALWEHIETQAAEQLPRGMNGKKQKLTRPSSPAEMWRRAGEQT